MTCITFETNVTEQGKPAAGKLTLIWQTRPFSARPSVSLVGLCMVNCPAAACLTRAAVRAVWRSARASGRVAGPRS